MKKTRIIISTILIIALLLSILGVSFITVSADTRSMTLHVEKNLLVNENGNAVRLIGGNFTVYGRDFANNPDYYGIIPSLEEKTFKELDLLLNDFGANVVRLHVKQDAWFSEDAGERSYYRGLLEKVIKKVTDLGKYVWINNHSGRYGGLPDAESEAFWLEIAELYKNKPNILFGLFNEPVGCNWEQWYYGTGDDKIEGSSGEMVQSKGMQHLVNIIRETGAKNVMIVDTPMWSSMFDGILSGEYALKDPSGNGIVYDPHIYTEVSDSHENIIEMAKRYPVIVGEVNSRMGHTNMVAEADYDCFEDFFDMANTYQMGICPWTFAVEDNGWGMLTLSDWKDNLSMVYTKTGEYFKNEFAKIEKTKAIQLHSKNASVALYHGKFTNSELKKQGFDISDITKVTKEDTYFNYKITLYKNSDFSGDSFVFYNKSANLSQMGLDFKPNSVTVEQVDEVNILKNSTIVASGGTDTAALVDGSEEPWTDNSEGVKTIIFELDKPYILYSTSLTGSKMGSNYLLSDFTVSVSTNGTNYVRIAELVNNKKSVAINNYEGLIANYLKITINKDSHLDSINEATIVEMSANGVEYSGEVKFPLSYAYIKYQDNADNALEDTDNSLTLEPEFEDSEDIIDAETDKIVTNRKLVYVTDWGMIIAIIVASVLGAAAVVTILIIVLKKRKKNNSIIKAKGENNNE